MVRIMKHFILSITILYWIVYIGSADSLLDQGYFIAATILLILLTLLSKRWSLFEQPKTE